LLHEVIEWRPSHPSSASPVGRWCRRSRVGAPQGFGSWPSPSTGRNRQRVQGPANARAGGQFRRERLLAGPRTDPGLLSRRPGSGGGAGRARPVPRGCRRGAAAGTCSFRLATAREGPGSSGHRGSLHGPGGGPRPGAARPGCTGPCFQRLFHLQPAARFWRRASARRRSRVSVLSRTAIGPSLPSGIHAGLEGRSWAPREEGELSPGKQVTRALLCRSILQRYFLLLFPLLTSLLFSLGTLNVLTL